MFIILIILQLTSRQVNRVSNTWSPTKALAIANAKKTWWDYTGCTEVAVHRLLRIQKGLLIAQTCQETVCALALDLHTAWNPAFSISLTSNAHPGGCIWTGHGSSGSCATCEHAALTTWALLCRRRRSFSEPHGASKGVFFCSSSSWIWARAQFSLSKP